MTITKSSSKIPGRNSIISRLDEYPPPYPNGASIERTENV